MAKGAARLQLTAFPTNAIKLDKPPKRQEMISSNDREIANASFGNHHLDRLEHPRQNRRLKPFCRSLSASKNARVSAARFP